MACVWSGVPAMVLSTVISGRLLKGLTAALLGGLAIPDENTSSSRA